MGFRTHALRLAAGFAAIAAAALPAAADKTYDPGASDTEIKLGQTLPHSGPGSPYGVLGRAQIAYFEMLNEKGGINGRKVTLLSMDDAYSPPKTVEATRRLVEGDQVLALFGSLGTGPQAAVQRYLNAKKIPQLLLNTGSGRWNDPVKFPWTTPGLPMYTTEAHIFAKHILATKPDAKIAILSQHDDLGKEYVAALKEKLGDKAKTMIVGEQTYELADPTIDSQIIALANTGADVFYNITTGKATSQTIRKIAEIGWKPMHLIMSGSTASEIINAAGAEKAAGLITVKYRKNVGNPQWADDPDLKAYEAFRAKYLSNVDPNNDLAFAGYSQAVLLAKILEMCGDELTRENLLKKATTLKNVTAPALISGLAFSNTPSDYAPLKTLYLATYDGKDWKLGEKIVED